MGARCNFIFKDSEEGPWTVLYSHWGETEWRRDLAIALNHARPRWSDTSYCTRMVISKLLEGSLLDETGYGIYAITKKDLEGALLDLPIIIDMTTQEVEGQYWNSFIEYQEELAEYHDFDAVEVTQ